MTIPEINTEDLTKSENRVLQLLLKNAGLIVTRDEMIRHLYGVANTPDMARLYFAKSRTLDVHIHNLRRKISGSGVEIITTNNYGYFITQE